MEKLVELVPDLAIDMSLYGDQLWYLQSVVETVEKIAPTLGISMQTNSILTSIERFEELALTLGADLETPEIVAARTAFADAETAFKAAIAEKPGLTVLVCSPGPDNVYIASPDWMTDLAYYRDLGLNILTHTTEDFFALIGWEEIGNYPADLILVDARGDGKDAEFLKTNQVWNSLPAVAAGQVGNWYAGAPYSRLRLTSMIVELTALVKSAKADVVA
jgi:iron complex transport system substrate-binding protein